MRLLAGIAIGLFCVVCQAAEPVADTPPRWWKGNLHTHTLWSDGNGFPEMVADWYRERGYQFLGLSDHNVLSEGQKWLKRSEIEKRGNAGMIDAYIARFGGDWVERRGSGTDEEFRLKPLEEVQALLEERGRFLMVPAEEISDKFGEAPVHLGAVNLDEVIKPQGGKDIVEVIENNVRAVEQQSRETGREMLVHLNHPNFRWALTAEQVAQAVSERYFEIYNGHPGVNQLGDEKRMSIERMWDVANTIRMTKLEAPPLLGLASDDSHHYHEVAMKRSAPGRGWIMVRSRHLTPESLIKAIKAGDFYASTGVTLSEVRFETTAGRLELTIDGQEGVSYRTQFIGTRKSAPDRPGVTLDEAEGLNPQYTLSGDELYIRALVTSSRKHANPSFEGQMEQAWLQPIWAK